MKFLELMIMIVQAVKAVAVALKRCFQERNPPIDSNFTDNGKWLVFLSGYITKLCLALFSLKFYITVNFFSFSIGSIGGIENTV